MPPFNDYGPELLVIKLLQDTNQRKHSFRTSAVLTTKSERDSFRYTLLLHHMREIFALFVIVASR